MRSDAFNYYIKVFTEPGIGLLAAFLILVCLLPVSAIGTILSFMGLCLFLVRLGSIVGKIGMHYHLYGLSTNELLAKAGYRFGATSVYLSVGGSFLGLYLSMFFVNLAIFLRGIHIVPIVISSCELAVITLGITLMIFLLGTLLHRLNLAIRT